VYKALLCLILLACLVVFAVRTWHWPLVGDAPTIHYAVFLMEHGEAPYRQVVDVNMPGAWLVEWLAMHLLGGGSLAWRIFDLLEGAAAAAAMISIAWPYDRFAGFLAGSLFILLHGRDGLVELGQRDLSMTVLLLVAYVLAFSILRAQRPGARLWATALFGLFLGLATTVKPTPVLLAPPLVALLCLQLRRRREPWRRHLVAALAGFLVPLLAVLVFLLRQRAVPAFLTVIFRLIPTHAHLHRLPLGDLLLHSLAANLFPMVLLWLPVALFAGLRRNAEWIALLMGLLFGLASFCIQGKGYSYQRYPAEAFLLLMICIDLCLALRARPDSQPGARSRWIRPLAAVALAALTATAGVASTRKALQFNWQDREFDTMLRADLTQLGGPALNGKVQCMDMAVGCLASLYRLHLVQATGFLYDCYLLDPGNHYGYRRKFLAEMESDPPNVFVVTGHICGEAGTQHAYQQIHAWPQFADWFAAHYFLYAQRVPPSLLHWEGRPGPPIGFRIYLRDGFRPAIPATAPPA
jgi:hypothetical protein